MDVELFLLGISILFFLSIFAGQAGHKYGIPALLLFLSVGMLCGSDGLGIQFENLQVAQTIGTISLCIILFSGGLDTKISEIKPVVKQGVILATLGVLLTALILGFAIWWILGATMASAGIGLGTSLLLASTMSSTDSASVFSILRSKGLNLKNNLRPMLELESGSNDPMAYILTITLIGILNLETPPNYISAIGMLILQLAIGAVAGFLLGKLAIRLINRLKIANNSLYPILVFTICIFIFSSTYYLKGNAYLAVYISGLVIGNARFAHKRSALSFFDGLAWLSQLLMFLTLGLLVNPHELVPIIVPGLIISFIMIFLARPLSVFVSLLPFTKMHKKDKLFVSWVGLRGAVPIIFAIITLSEGVQHSRLIFNIVFFCTLVSLIVQGTTLANVAKLLGLADKPTKSKTLENFDLEFSDEIKSATSEIRITAEMLSKGNHLMDLPLPEKTLAVMVKRNNKFFIPTGKTILAENDIILIITDDQEALQQTLNDMGIA
ncbi:MAG TPA: potassium/proton antiporter [Tenuifilaceae bacterium]|nr:potassium/proton antiporter [Tenuifilaceae bacterium]HQB76982.1 potassium/proton antiporter [Tenuifilaceae bacterium]